MKKILHVTIFLLLSIYSDNYASTTGKISGIVRDLQNGEPLPGANVIIEGTMMGAAADHNGFFFIINIPPGKYKVTASMMGYETQKQVGVQVATDVTTRLSFDIKPTVIEGESITVLAQRPAIQKDLTSSVQSYASDEIIAAPVENLSQIIDLQAGINAKGNESSGFVSGAPGDGLHIRGGRENETLFLVDGVKVGDDIYGGSRYIQNTSGSSISEMKTIIGTFNAEYGGKMAGVISVVTKDGGERFSAGFKGYTDRFGMKTFDRNTFQGEITLSGPIPFVQQFSFYLNAQTKTTNGRSDVYTVDIPYWRDSKGLVGRFSDGDKIPADWKDEWNGMFKLTYKPLLNIKFMGSFYHSWAQDARYDHDYRFLPYSQPFRETRNSGMMLKMIHTLSTNTFYELIGSYQSTDFFYGIDKVRERKNLLGERVTTGYYYYSGSPHDYNVDSSRTWQAVFNLTSQWNNQHQIKTGLELRRLHVFHRMDMAGGTPVQEIDGKIYEVHMAYAARNPIEVAAYFQDKMEFEEIGMIMNAGARIEMWNQKMEYMEFPDLPYSTPMKPTDVKVRLSPRFGISFPVSDKAAFHLAYGHFYQLPRYMELLSGLVDVGYFAGRPNLNDPGPGISNPNAKPEKTVSYETGVQFQLTGEMSMNITAFYREMSDLMGVLWMEGGGGYVYLDNVDFGNAKGVEFILEKRLSDLWSTRVNYTWSTSKISTSSPFTAAQKNRFISYRTFLSDWDRPHNLNALLLVSNPSSWAVSLIGNARSGRPYSVLAEVINTERMPWEITFDLRVSKFFAFCGLEESLYLQIFNVFDRRNVLNVYSETGKWDDDGLYGTPPDRDANPRRISDGRTARLGIQLNF